MNTDILFWWTGWATWLIISCVIAMTVLGCCVFIYFRTLRVLKEWTGAHIIRKRILDDDWEATQNWPKMGTDKEVKIIMGFMRRVADQEKRMKKYKSEIPHE
jgi:hypothetical protein